MGGSTKSGINRVIIPLFSKANTTCAISLLLIVNGEGWRPHEYLVIAFLIVVAITCISDMAFLSM
jgi:hypothetical protein